MYNQFKLEADRKWASAIAFAFTAIICAILWRVDIGQYIHTDTATKEYISDVVLLLCLATLVGAIKNFIESFILKVRAWRAKSKEAK